MAYLNWAQDPYTQLERADSETGTLPHQVNFSLEGERIKDLCEALSYIFEKEGGELRMDCPGGWLFFWKLRREENRTLLAHPEENTWVATIALEKESGIKLISELKLLKEGTALDLSRLMELGRVSNFELRLKLQAAK